VSPTSRVAAVLAILALGMLVVPVGLVLLAVLAVAAAVLVDLRFARQVPTVRSAVPSVAARGVPTPVLVEVVGGPTRTRVRQPFPPDLSLTPDEEDDHLAGALVARRRGRHRVPAPVVRCTGPLGLARVDHQAGDGTDLVVYPDLPAARRLAGLVREGRFDPEGRRRRGPMGLGTEFEHVRDYSPDDDIRQVNWLASARVDRPMSNQYRLDQDREVVLLVDSGRLMAAPVEGRTRLDAAIDAAVAVAAVADVLGDRCGSVAFADGLRRQVAPRRGAGRRVVEALFDLEALPEDSDYDRAFQAVAGRKRALVLVLTDLLDEAAARSLVPAVPVLSRRHAVVVAGVRDPDLAAILRTHPERLEDVCAQSVAVELAEGRDRVVRNLERAGATVVDVPPDRLSEACVAAYLRLKARGRA
jgi:uncharacterized protein (DUF58 family)